MPVEAVALVLREDDDAPQAGVDQVRERAVDPAARQLRDAGAGAAAARAFASCCAEARRSAPSTHRSTSSSSAELRQVAGEREIVAVHLAVTRGDDLSP